MKTLCSFVSLLVSIQFVTCRDFYLGMFKKNDFLVAQDNIYKAAAPFGYTTVTYGRLFKCPITYFRVVDRLGMGRGPITTIVRGGLRKKFISARIKSNYRLPISVNIYVGCENKKPTTRKIRTTSTHTTTTKADTPATDSDPDTTAPDADTTEPGDTSPDSGTGTGADAGTETTAENEPSVNDTSSSVEPSS